MRSDFEELKRFAIADILSVSGRQKTTETVDMHINTIIDIAFLKGQQASQSKVDELQKKNAWLSDVAERENKRANKLQEEKVSTTTLLGKTIQEKNELQKRVDEQGLIIAKVMSIASELQKSWEMFEIGKKLEQALKGGSDETN